MVHPPKKEGPQSLNPPGREAPDRGKAYFGHHQCMETVASMGYRTWGPGRQYNQEGYGGRGWGKGWAEMASCPGRSGAKGQRIYVGWYTHSTVCINRGQILSEY